MTWSTLSQIQTSTRCEFTPALAAKHHFVRLPSGRWCRTLGIPGLTEYQKADGYSLTQITTRTWHMKVRVS